MTQGDLKDVKADVYHHSTDKEGTLYKNGKAIKAIFGEETMSEL